MWKSAQSGNVTAQIWLSKNLLGMRDNVDTPPVEMPDFVVRIEGGNDADVAGAAAAIS